MNFAVKLETDEVVSRWLRPSSRQFKIYYSHHSKLYEPDFVVESPDDICLVEIKAKNEIMDGDVQEKAKAALAYCEEASKYTASRGGKEWKYALIPHDTVKPQMTYRYLVDNYRF
jgi:type III restriction enzyme